METTALNMENTVAANLSGNPALALPIPVQDKVVPLTSLELVGPDRSEAALLNAGRLVEAHVRQNRACAGRRARGETMNWLGGICVRAIPA